MTDIDTTETEAPDAAATTNGKAKGQMPTYKLSKVEGALPDNAVAAGRSDLYFDLLTDVAKDPGEWYEVAHFKTPGGARSAAKAIENGERKIPDGEWEIEHRRVDNPDGKKKHSKLFARFMG